MATIEIEDVRVVIWDVGGHVRRYGYHFKNRNQCDQCGASTIVIVMVSFSLSIVVIQIDLKK